MTNYQYIEDLIPNMFLVTCRTPKPFLTPTLFPPGR